MRSQDTSLGDRDFHYVLMRGQIVEKMLSERERRSLYDFFRDGFLDRIEAQSCFVDERSRDLFSRNHDANEWIFQFNSLGIVAPVIQPIWEAWWMLDRSRKRLSAR